MGRHGLFPLSMHTFLTDIPLIKDDKALIAYHTLTYGAPVEMHHSFSVSALICGNTLALPLASVPAATITNAAPRAVANITVKCEAEAPAIRFIGNSPCDRFEHNTTSFAMILKLNRLTRIL